MAAPNHAPATWKNGTLTINDGTGTPKTIDVVYVDKGTTISVTRSIMAVDDRGTHKGYSEDADAKVELKIKCKLVSLLSDGVDDVSLREAIFGVDQASSASWITSGTTGFAYVIEVIWVIDGTARGWPADNTVTLSGCVCTAWSVSEDDPDTIEFTLETYDADPALAVT